MSNDSQQVAPRIYLHDYEMQDDGGAVLWFRGPLMDQTWELTADELSGLCIGFEDIQRAIGGQTNNPRETAWVNGYGPRVPTNSSLTPKHMLKCHMVPDYWCATHNRPGEDCERLT